MKNWSGCRENAPVSWRPGSVSRAKPGSAGSFADLIVADPAPSRGLSWLDYGQRHRGADRRRDRILSPRRNARRTPQDQRQTAARGVREYVEPQDGDGWWGLLSGCPITLSLSITEAAYRKDRWISVEGGAFFKIRVLARGAGLLNRDGRHSCSWVPQARHPATSAPARARRGLQDRRPGADPRWWSLHCGPELLSEAPGPPTRGGA